MTKRRDVLKIGLGAGLATGLSGLARHGVAQAQDALAFDPAAFTELTKVIETATGSHDVTYRFWKAVSYVARPVDAAYQSLNISQPIRIDGREIDASGAPILLANAVGGYMPSSVADADGISGGGMRGRGGPGGGMRGGPGGRPPGVTGPMEAPTGSNAMLDRGRRVSNAELALAAGYVVVEAGARGRTLTDAAGNHYGVAPAAIVDLKAAVRYLRHNAGRLPGNTGWIVSSGTSAGGALSALLGASGDSPLYGRYLEEIGAAEASDAIFATGAWCPIADLEHADMAYEWNWGGNPLASGTVVDATVSGELRAAFADYQLSLGLRQGAGERPRLTAENLGDHIAETYLRPAATRFLAALPDADRAAYMAANPVIGWENGEARFGWAEFLAHAGARKKDVPAFDAFDLSTGENNLFGLGQTAARHFTRYSLRHASGDPAAELDADIPGKLALMNPMHFLSGENPGRARHWWLRVGAKDSDTSLSVVANLAASLEKRGNAVDTRMYWDAGHGANEDAAEFMAWIGRVTGYAG
ncbi:Tat pathway signal sequence domain protein (plasmid) [Agrobacterium tumefaciens]|uniref:subtype B tannase n=1 Tax=Agrobacterium tumefaciens TaxID=358 RepID=UPI0021D0D0A2|nr:subtype B tannase [Agrobacterium tumefaciens]UXT68953.1 Tat pathway signal sequence domain protein [Agrobacterium tumefaciens]